MRPPLGCPLWTALPIRVSPCSAVFLLEPCQLAGGRNEAGGADAAVGLQPAGASAAP